MCRTFDADRMVDLLVAEYLRRVGIPEASAKN